MNRTVKDLNPFYIQKACDTVEPVNNVFMLQNGYLLVEAQFYEHSKPYTQKLLASYPITVEKKLYNQLNQMCYLLSQGGWLLLWNPDKGHRPVCF